MTTSDGADRRKSPRLPVELHVEFRHLGKPSETYAEICKDLSEGGVFLDTSVGLELGTTVELEITPSVGGKPIRMSAEVVRVEQDPAATGSKATNRTRGMGLRFLDADPTEVARLLTLAKQKQAESAQAGARKERRG